MRVSWFVVTALLLIGAARAAAVESFQANLSPAALTDQLGRNVDLARELATPDGVAVLSFFFKGCKSACPVAEAEMHFLDAQLAPHAQLLTLTLDPSRDTVERLARHASEIGASARWRFLTGERETIYALLDRLNVSFGALDDHPTVVFVAVHGQLYRLNGQPDAREIAALVRRLAP